MERFFCLVHILCCSVIMRNMACRKRWARWELAAVPMTNSLTLPTRNISSCVELNTCLDLHGPPDGRECWYSYRKSLRIPHILWAKLYNGAKWADDDLWLVSVLYQKSRLKGKPQSLDWGILYYSRLVCLIK